MVDRQFSEAGLARLYDAFHPWGSRGDFDFYLPLIMAAESVLDVGCGTGALLRGAREAGHRGRLCGLDPAGAMLDVARRRPDVEWVCGDLASVAWDGEFDLVVMTGHAFQVLLSDVDVRGSLGAVRAALTDDGRFVFETRNPSVREWEQWTPENAIEILLDDGAVVRMAHQVEAVEGDLVRFSSIFTSSAWDRARLSTSTLRFLGRGPLSSFLSGAGLAVEEQFGDWAGNPLTARSPEIITVARRE